jgi:hypothetical protein
MISSNIEPPDGSGTKNRDDSGSVSRQGAAHPPDPCRFSGPEVNLSRSFVLANAPRPEAGK